ncbi:MAG: hypothetical protein AMJ56_14480 [Anaerolineae bacterium SG8_19]|jgi:hypothetical protein|nr:MAG: hypothetical protein AMJ56_14480 [Anaerolineae bacterium SG8_19]
MKRLRLIFLLTVAVLLLANCHGEFSNVCDSYFHEITNCTDAWTLPVENGENKAELYMQVNLSAGAITWTLQDPSGNVRWEERCEASNGPELITFREFSTPAAGNWHLELDLQDAIGEYRGVWKTQ